MIKVEVRPEALGRVRLTYSPMWELAASLRLLLHEPGSGRHAPWLRWAQQQVEPELLDLLSGLMPTAYRFADFLSPPPGARPRSIKAELAAIAELPARQVNQEIEATTPTTVPAPLRRLLDGPNATADLARALDRYWQRALAPVWPQLRHLLAADVAFRADELAAEGLHALLNGLHPTVSFDGTVLSVDKPRHDGHRDCGVSGIALLPCAFAWPDVLIVACEPYPVTLSYGPRGVGALWHTQKRAAARPVAALIGRSRAAILALLDRPASATMLADQTGLSLPAVSQHLTVLRTSGLVSCRRSGRTVWSTRTDLGSELLRSASG